jgi:hypothetical protein
MADLKKGARVTHTTRDRLAADLKKKYERGASIRALAESTGRSYGFVHRVLRESGVQIRGRSGASQPSGNTRGSSRTSQPSGKTGGSASTSKPSENAQRAHARRLLEALPDSRVDDAVALLRELTDSNEASPTRRRFRTVGVFDGEPDLGKRAKEIVREDLRKQSEKTA